MQIKLKFPDSIPESEVNVQFLQAMVDRLAVSYLRYGRMADGFPHKVNALKTLQLKLDEYERSANTESLVDAANYALIEFTRPSKPNAHFTPTDTSKGRVWNGEVDPLRDENLPRKVHPSK